MRFCVHLYTKGRCTLSSSFTLKLILSGARLRERLVFGDGEWRWWSWGLASPCPVLGASAILEQVQKSATAGGALGKLCPGLGCHAGGLPAAAETLFGRVTGSLFCLAEVRSCIAGSAWPSSGDVGGLSSSLWVVCGGARVFQRVVSASFVFFPMLAIPRCFCILFWCVIAGSPLTVFFFWEARHRLASRWSYVPHFPVLIELRQHQLVFHVRQKVGGCRSTKMCQGLLLRCITSPTFSPPEPSATVGFRLCPAAVSGASFVSVHCGGVYGIDFAVDSLVQGSVGDASSADG